MPKQKEPIALYRSNAGRFREIKTDLTEELGYESTNPEIFGHPPARNNHDDC